MNFNKLMNEEFSFVFESLIEMNIAVSIWHFSSNLFFYQQWKINIVFIRVYSGVLSFHVCESQRYSKKSLTMIKIKIMDDIELEYYYFILFIVIESYCASIKRIKERQERKWRKSFSLEKKKSWINSKEFWNIQSVSCLSSAYK